MPIDDIDTQQDLDMKERENVARNLIVIARRAIFSNVKPLEIDDTLNDMAQMILHGKLT